jgi:hypothetical protein
MLKHFYYSKKQSEHLTNNNKMPVHKDVFKRHYALISGVATLYTDSQNTGYYDDMVLLGVGVYSHSEGVW